MCVCKEGEDGMGSHLLGTKVQQENSKTTNQHYH
jgi:hypothetical protein